MKFLNTALISFMILLMTSCTTVQPRYQGSITDFTGNRTFSGVGFDSIFEITKKAYRSSRFMITDDNYAGKYLIAKKKTEGGYVTSTAYFYELNGQVKISLSTQVPRINVNAAKVHEEIFKRIEQNLY